jgi:hypothetical protein
MAGKCSLKDVHFVKCCIEYYRDVPLCILKQFDVVHLTVSSWLYEMTHYIYKCLKTIAKTKCLV